MLEGKDYKSIDMVFPFFAAFIDNTTSCRHQEPLTTVDTACSDLFCGPSFNDSGAKDEKNYCAEIENKFQFPKNSSMRLFEYLKNENLFKLRFYGPNHISEDGKRFGDISFLDATSFQHLNYMIKQLIRSSSGRHSTAMEETLKTIKFPIGGIYEVSK